MKYKNKITKILLNCYEFIPTTLLFLIIVLIMRGVETILILDKITLNAEIICRGFVTTLIMFCAFSICTFPLYFGIRLKSKKLSIIVTSIIYSLVFLFELSATIYSIQTGMLLGVEIFLRPFSETWQTIGSFMNIWLVLVFVFVIIACFIFASFLLVKRKWNKIVIICLSSIIIFFACCYCLLPTMLRPHHKNIPAVKNFITNKTNYLLANSIEYYRMNKEMNNGQNKDKNKKREIPYDEDKINEFLKDHPEWEVPDKHYPLERKNNPDNNIGHFFVKSDNIKPNIVLIIVESLGKEFADLNNYDVSFTPFLDSLANTGLYWENCLSTTPRSFGAVPALTGSVPFGNRGFQIGIMPAHNSLLSVLRNNGYTLNAFQSADFSFDGIGEFLTENKIDYLSPFYSQAEKDKDVHIRTNWGYNDSVMFNKSIGYLNEYALNKATFNLFITIQMHEPLSENNPYFINTIKKTKKMLDKLQPNIRKKIPYADNFLASVLFTDNALNNFFNQYKQREDFNNTIFIITGDHSSGKNCKIPIDYYHVPLIIWSPLIKENKKFSALVSHNDLTPSIVALLQKNFNFKAPEYVHWVGQELDTNINFTSNQKTTFLSYGREDRSFLYQDLFLEEGIVSKIINNCYSLKEDNYNLKSITEKLNSYMYVDKYTYVNNRLTKYPIYTNSKNQKLREIFLPDSIYMCFTKDTVKYPIFSNQVFKKSELKYINILMTFKVYIIKKLYLDWAPELIIDISNQDKNIFHSYYSYEKYIVNNKTETKKWLNVEVSKKINVETDLFDVNIFFNNTWGEEDDVYSMYIKDIHIVIDGEK